MIKDERKTKGEPIEQSNTFPGRIVQLEQVGDALRESDEKSLFLLKNTPDVILNLDHDGTILFINHTMPGYTVEDTVGKTIYDLIPPEQYDKIRNAIAKVFQTGEAVDFESSIIRPDGGLLRYSTRLGPVKDGDKIVSAVQISTDITQRKKTEEVLRESEQRYRDIFNSATDAILILDSEDYIVDANPEACKIFGYSREEMIGLDAYKLVHPDYRRKTEEFKNAIEPTGQTHFEAVNLRKDGSPFNVEVRETIFANNGNKHFLVTLRDITERKRAQEALRLKNVAIESSINGIAFVDTQGNLTYVNESFLKLWGYSDEKQVLGKPAVGYWADPDKAAEIREIVLNRGGWTGELVAKKKDGSIFDVELSASMVKDENANPVCLMASFLDITERKRAEQATRESEEKYRTLYETTQDGIAGGPMDGRIFECNQAFAEMLGYSKAELANLTYQQLTPKRWHQMEAEIVQEQILKRGYSDEYEKEYIKKDGTVFPVSARVWLRKDKDGKPVGMWGIVRDITERKRAQEALRESQQQKRALLDSIPDLAWLKDKEGRYIAANEPLCKALDMKLEDLVGKTDFDISPEDLAKRYRADDEKVMKSGKRKRVGEPWGKKNGKRIWIETIKTPIYNDRGDVVGTSGIARDITERKKAEEKIKLFSDAIAGAIDAIAITDLKGIITYANPSMEEIFGYEKGELIGKSVTALTLKPEIAEEMLSTLIKTGSWNGEVLHQKKNKETFPTLLSLSTIRDEKGNPIATMGAVRDITERKKAEEALRDSEERLRVALSAAQMGTWRWDPVTNQDTRDASLNLILGLEAVESTQPVEDFLHFVHPEDRDMTNEEIQRAIRERRTYVAEFRIIRPDGTVRWLRDQGQPLCDENNRVLCLTGVVIDITDRKKAEEQIRRLSSAVEQSIDGIAIGDLEPRLLYVNDAFARMYGYTREEMIGMPVTKLFNKEQMDEYKKAVSQQEIQDFWEGEIGHIKKDGTAFLTYVSVTILKNSDGKPTGTLAVTRDITEVKRREEELNIYREKMAQTEQLASLGTLSATVAHELTQPLTVIRLSIENALAKLETTSSAVTITKNIEDSLTEVSSITSIVERFRNYARRSTKTITGEVDLKAVAERTVQLLSQSARQARVTLHLEGMDELPPVYSSEKDVEQLFFALIENAVQAADGKKIRGLIIGGDVQDEHIELRFSDNCGGIAPENLDRIFEPFFTTKPADEGTGLGLCIVEQIVSRAGGKVRVESKAGKGTTFFITLPINKGKKS